MRLGFAVAIHVDPDVLLVDEVLAVGDEGFTHKCLDKFSDFRRRGKTILLVTHSLGLVERFCDEALWLDAGRVRTTGDPRRVVGAYITAVERGEEAQLAAEDARARDAVARTETVSAEGKPDDPVAVGGEAAPNDMFLASAGRWGSREVEIVDVALLGDDGTAGHVFHSGSKLIVRLDVRAREPITDFVFGIGLFNGDGVCCYGTNTDLEELVPQQIAGDGRVEFVVDSLDLTEGTYKIDVAVHKRDGYPYDYHRLLYTFRVKSRTKDVGIYRPPHRWEFSKGVRLTPRV
jgi:hypothetical protein